jgi:ribosomal protein L20
MVSKMRQTMKNIESRFVKTHLYGVLVHGIGLYADVWIDAHHKHDSNQVITSVMHVIADVRRRKGRYRQHYEYRLTTTRKRIRIYTYSLFMQLLWGWDTSRRYNYVFL